VPHCSILGDCACSGHCPPFSSGVVTVNVCDRWPPPHVTEHAVHALHVPTQFVGAASTDGCLSVTGFDRTCLPGNEHTWLGRGGGGRGAGLSVARLGFGRLRQPRTLSAIGLRRGDSERLRPFASTACHGACRPVTPCSDTVRRRYMKGCVTFDTVWLTNMSATSRAYLAEARWWWTWGRPRCRIARSWATALALDTARHSPQAW
jgi:hypothetical protein